MKYFILIITLIQTIISANAEISESSLRSRVEILISSQIGESEAWDDSLSGGYIVRFSADVFGDPEKEEFLASSRSFSPNASWLVFSNGRRIGFLSLSGFEFIVIRGDKATLFPDGLYTGGFGGISLQTLDADGVSSESREVSPDELGKLRSEWAKQGQTIRPKLEMLLLVDYLNGSRDWQVVDLDTEPFYFRGETKSLVLERDFERLEQLNLRPEKAMELFQLMPSEDQADDPPEITPPPKKKAAPIAPEPTVAESPKQSSADFTRYLWIVAVIAVLAIFVLLFRRLRKN